MATLSATVPLSLAEVLNEGSTEEPQFSPGLQAKHFTLIIPYSL
jgi:hypothetical protein